jgi:BirA family biotin operon repressor/biotin-[acetyl-CoA-carboxylase] ligase
LPVQIYRLMPSHLETLFIGRHLIALDETDSTNAQAQQLLAMADPPEGTVIYAHHQKAGKGQRGANWESEERKNLTFSILLKPQFLTAKNSFQLSKVIALGIIDHLSSFLKMDFKIKWPNDIYFLNNKISGILIENTLRGQQISNAIVGIGLNINQIKFINSQAISVKKITGTEQPLEQHFYLLCASIEKRYLQLKSGNNAVIDKDYLEALYGYNLPGNYRSGTREFSAKIIQITEEGKLILKEHDGLQKSYDFKEVVFLMD